MNNGAGQPDTLHEIDFRSLFERWAEGSGPFTCFFSKANFVSLKHYPDFSLRQPKHQANRLFRLVGPSLQNAGPAHLAIFDIPARAGIRLACLLQNRLQIKPILTFLCPLHPHGLVGGSNYVNDLAVYGLALKPVEAKGFAFILDSRRYRTRVTQRTLKERFNNQYELGPDNLPGVEMLNALSISQVSFYHLEPAMEDAAAYVQHLRQNNIELDELIISKTDLQ
ncbi:MAG: hypothetical protein ABFD04_05540 [Syntrophomonas sp.]